MGKYINADIVGKRQEEKDKDLVAAELMLQNADLQQQINDMGMVIADIIQGGTAK